MENERFCAGTDMDGQESCACTAGSNHKAPTMILRLSTDKRKTALLRRNPALRQWYPILCINAQIRGVDKNDLMKSNHTVLIAGKKWWSRMLL